MTNALGIYAARMNTVSGNRFVLAEGFGDQLFEEVSGRGKSYRWREGAALERDIAEPDRPEDRMVR